MIYKILLGLVLAAVVGVGAYFILRDRDGGVKDYGTEVLTFEDAPTALIETNYGNFKIRFYPEDAPKTVENFTTLAKKGFYDGLTFHRVIKNFMIQGGDPNCIPERSTGPCGTGGPGYKFEDELNPNTPSAKEGYKKGVVAMANSGPNTNGSQFFIMVANVPLPHQYTIFGKVAEGQEIVDKIGLATTGPNDKPLRAAIIQKITVN